MNKLLMIFLISCFGNILLYSQTESVHKFITEAGITFSHFQQQVKTEIGAERGERLTNEFQIGLYTAGAYRFYEFFAAGIYLRYDRGQRYLANFDGFDQSGKTLVKDRIGGTYTEFWAGPVVHFFYKQLKASFGYGLFGLRKDAARNDIPSTTGDVESAFKLDPSFAWLFSLGGSFSVIESLDVLFSLEYRARYYNSRDGNKLANDINHGTQSISPLFGVVYSF